VRALSGAALLAAWEEGSARGPAGRAVALLAAATPRAERDALERLPLGARDGRLLELREATFGPTLRALASCPRCGERLEFALPADGIRAPHAADAETVHPLEHGGLRVRFRVPTGADLAAAGARGDPDEARRVLLRRCVVEAEREGEPVDPAALHPDEEAALAAAMAAADPQAEVLIALCCEGCGHAWETALDVAEFLWTEVGTEAQRLLYEVHALASAYGWREGDVLALSPARRRAYLEMVGA
jgi:hypothetical protein